MPVPRKVKPWRGFPNANVVHAIRARVRQSGARPGYGEFGMSTTAFGATTRLHIGTIPAGAILLPASRRVEEALAATSTLDVVKSDGTVVYNILAAGVGAAPAANSFLEVLPVLAVAGANMPTVDTPLYLQLGVALSTTGIIDILIPFYMNKD